MSLEACVCRYQEGDAQAGEAILQTLMPFIGSQAKKYANALNPVEDLKQEGCIGALRAASLYDPAKGTKFFTFAYRMIIGEMLHAIRDRGELIRHPGYVHEVRTSTRSARVRLLNELGREPTLEEIASETRDPVSRIETVQKNNVSALQAGEYINRKVMRVPAPDDYRHADGRLWLDQALVVLNERDRAMVRMWGSGCSLSELARAFGLTAQGASAALKRSFAKVRKWAKRSG